MREQPHTEVAFHLLSRPDKAAQWLRTGYSPVRPTASLSSEETTAHSGYRTGEKNKQTVFDRLPTTSA